MVVARWYSRLFQGTFLSPLDRRAQYSSCFITVSIFTHPRYTNSLGQFPHKGTHIHLPEVRNHACTRLKARYDEKGNSHFLLAYIPTDILQRDLDRLLAGLRAPTPVKLKDLQAPRLETKAI